MQIFRAFLFLCNRELVARTPGLISHDFPLSKGTVITINRRVRIKAQDATGTATRQVILPMKQQKEDCGEYSRGNKGYGGFLWGETQ